MTIYDNIFPLGIGTNRLPISGVDDFDGLERSAGIIASALNKGASYIDVSHTYSRGFAMTACKLAFEMSDAPKNITVKASFKEDKTADDALSRIEKNFKGLNIDHASYFVIWNIENLVMFEKITQKGFLYDGALKAKSMGLIDHICFSTHAPANEIITMLESGAFEGVTISFSAMNGELMKPVLDCALKNNIGVAVMNPLGGGVIPQNADYFSFLRHESDISVAQAAISYVLAHPAVNVVISGLSSLSELEENLLAVTIPLLETNTERIARVEQSMRNLPNYCTGCRYCDECPVGIPIYELMQSRNAGVFNSTPIYNRTEPELLRDIQMLRKLYLDFQFLPQNADNPCVKCGKCEGKCTQGLKTIEIVADFYKRVQKRGFTRESRREKLGALLSGKAYKRVAFYPGAGYTRAVLHMYREFFGEPPFEILLFDSNPAMWGTVSDGIEVYSPVEIPKLEPEIIIVSNYIYLDEIYNNLRHFENDGITVVKLHSPDDVPWVF